MNLLGKTCSLTPPWRSYFFIWKTFPRHISPKILGDWGNTFLPQSGKWKTHGYANERKTQQLLKFTFTSHNKVIKMLHPSGQSSVLWALHADCPQVGNRAVNCTKGRQDIWDILRCFSSLQHGWLMGVTPWSSSAKLLRAHGSLCPLPGARQPGPPSIPVAHQQDPHLLWVACNAPETLRQNKYFCFFLRDTQWGL